MRLSTIWIVRGLVVALGLVLATTMMVRTSGAVFSGATSNPDNSWATGSVSLSDTRSGSAMFSTGVDGTLAGGQILTKCITVTYTGSLVGPGTTVKMYGASNGALAPYLNVAVEESASAASADCTGFTGGTSIYNGSLAALGSTKFDFATGAGGNWHPSATNQSRTYKVSVTVSADTAAQAKAATGTFTWEAQA